MGQHSSASVDEPARDPALARTLDAAGLPTTGRYVARAGWASRVWIGDELVVRLGDGRARDSFRHEATVVGLLTGSEVPHARHLGHGDGPDGPWSVSTRLPGRTLHDAWPAADAHERRAMIESLGTALRALHRVAVPEGLMPPWLVDALAGGPRAAYHPPVVGAALRQVEAAQQAAQRRPEGDSRLLADVAAWVRERMALFASDAPVLVHGDLHGSNVMVDAGRVTGLVDFAESLAAPADVELDTLLRWCARSREYPPVPGGQGLDPATLVDVPTWLRGAYPELFAHERLHERLLFYDVQRELALSVHHPDAHARATARDRLADALSTAP